MTSFLNILIDELDNQLPKILLFLNTFLDSLYYQIAGEAYFLLGSYEKAIELYTISCKLIHSLDNIRMKNYLPLLYQKIAQCYVKQQQWHDALHYLVESFSQVHGYYIKRNVLYHDVIIRNVKDLLIVLPLNRAS